MNKTFTKAQELLHDFTSLFFPNICMACMHNAPVHDEYLCMECKINLPTTDFHLFEENIFTNRLWGRFPLQSGTAQLLMIKGGLAENIIYNIKYRNATQLAINLGEKYGRKLVKAPLYKDVDVIVPVPIHASKMRTRGYNQSAMFGSGLSESMNIPLVENVLIKKRKTKSQTKKSRLNRLLSVQNEYVIKKPERLIGKHILLVDDVLTTGATIESCALELLKVEGVRLSLATIAFKAQ